MTKKERIEHLKKEREKEDKLFHNDFIRCRGDKRKKINRINMIDVVISKNIERKYGKRKKIHCIYKCNIETSPNIVYLINWEKDILHSMLVPISKKEINEYYRKNRKEFISLLMLNNIHYVKLYLYSKKTKKLYDTNLNSKITLEKRVF